MLQGVATFSARNNWDPLFGLDDGAAYKEWLYLSKNATVPETMLVALCHMQVNVCLLRHYQGGGAGISGFRTNIIAFPQEALELKSLRHFWSSLQVHDVVNIRLPEDTSNATKARVVGLEKEGVRVRVVASGEEHVLALECIEQRVVLPWKPSQLSDYLVIFRRRSGRTEDYVEDLRVRRGIIKRLLRLFTTRGFYRPHHGE